RLKATFPTMPEPPDHAEIDWGDGGHSSARVAADPTGAVAVVADGDYLRPGQFEINVALFRGDAGSVTAHVTAVVDTTPPGPDAAERTTANLAGDERGDALVYMASTPRDRLPAPTYLRDEIDGPITQANRGAGEPAVAVALPPAAFAGAEASPDAEPAATG